MAFQILNDPAAPNNAAAFEDQAEVDSVDIDILAAALGGTGVVSGCAVTVGAGVNQVSVASGVVVIAGLIVTVVAQANQAVTAADGTNNRIDLVSINTSGTVVVTAGTAATNACYPDIPASNVVIAAVFREAADAAIAATDITDKRCILGAPIIPGAWAKTGHINPVAVSGSFNNVNPTGFTTCSTYIQDLTGNATFTGLTGGSTGRRILLVNGDDIASGFTLSLTNEAVASSTDVNCFHCPNEVTYVLGAGESVELEYDPNDPGGSGAAGRWRVIDRAYTGAVTLEKLYVWHMGSGAAITGNALGGYLATNNLGLTETVTRIIITSDPTAGTSATVVIELNSSDDLDTVSWATVQSNAVGSGEEGYIKSSAFTDSSLETNRLLRVNITAVVGTYNNMTVKMYTTMTQTVTIT